MPSRLIDRYWERCWTGLKSASPSLLLLEGGGDFTLPSRFRPRNDDCIEWVYEIDLDRNIFHINRMPFFSLQCLPEDKAFIQYISEDHYGHIACASQCPPEHKYKKPASPIIDNSILASYQSLICTGSSMVLSDLLVISNILSRDEHVRVSLLEVMIGRCMVNPVFRRGDIRTRVRIRSQSTHRTISGQSLWFMASIAFVPQIFGDDLKDNPGDYFGIAFSVYHCAVVKVVKDAHTMTFSYTNALQFLPSFYADSPSTPGITALARLGYRNDPALFERAVELCYDRPTIMRMKWGQSLHHGANGSDDVSPNTICPSLPLELWKEIALHLRPFDLITFGLVSTLYREAASMVLRYPHLCGYRLVTVPKKKPGYLQDQYLFLHSGSFYAERTGVPATVVVGLRFRSEPLRNLDLPLKVTDLRLWPIPFSVSLDVDGKPKLCWV
ncbi:hypothetical protein F4604DRAFT_1958391 [Suillus subluteus]|nr:hypothetical protein F4604DRAFT_1958391 [Suillus subluteus]